MFKIPFKTKKPKSAAINEEIKIINFELFIIVSLSKASKVTKIDIVKPIPAKSPTPKIDFQFKSDGSLQSPKVTAKSAKIKIPKGLPTIRPSAIPKLLFSVNVCEMSPALAQVCDLCYSKTKFLIFFCISTVHRTAPAGD